MIPSTACHGHNIYQDALCNRTLTVLAKTHDLLGNEPEI